MVSSPPWWQPFWKRPVITLSDRTKSVCQHRTPAILHVFTHCSWTRFVIPSILHGLAWNLCYTEWLLSENLIKTLDTYNARNYVYPLVHVIYFCVLSWTTRSYPPVKTLLSQYKQSFGTYKVMSTLQLHTICILF